jgi:crotonobetainyl-CoA:carnitine CoA-transferase CaiB-like acyl-CoA transferase
MLHSSISSRLSGGQVTDTVTSQSGPLAGLTVVDASAGPAGAMTSMLLADSGADVLRIETGAAPEVDRVAYRVWHRGKRSVRLDPGSADHRAALRRLASAADVLIESFPAALAAELGLDAQSLSTLNPRLVSCSIGGYGPDDSRPAYDALVAARTGLQWEQRGVPGTPMNRISGAPVPMPDIEVPDLAASRFGQEGPVFVRSLWTSVGTAYLATAGISAALRAREVTGRGDRVETSLLRGAMAAAGPVWQRAEHADAPGYWMWVTDRRAPEGLFECADGRWVHFWTIRPTLILEAAEADQLVIKAPDDQSKADLGVRIGMEAEDLIPLYYYYELLTEAFRKFPSDQWIAFAEACGLGLSLVRSPEEAFSDAALLKQGCVVEVNDPDLGPIRHAGVLLEFSETPGAVRGPAPRPGQHTDEVLTELGSAQATGRAATGPAETWEPGRALPRGPLHGIRVLDLGLGVAGPWGGRVLADLGADVIKVHALYDGYWARTHMGLGTNWGKRSIALNLKHPAGREVLDRLLETADVLAHNMRPGAAERLGIGYEQLRTRFPRLVYCHTRGFDDGPRSTRPGTDQTANALAGTEYEDGACGFGAPPLWSRVNMGDTGNGYLWAIAVMQALYHRERTGRGQRVGTAIINATLLLTSYALSLADGTAVERPRIDARQRGLSALHGLYKLAGDEAWACLAVLTDDTWTALCETTGAAALLDDPRFATADDRRRHDAELRAELERVLAGWTAADLDEVADSRGLPCEIVSQTYSTELFDDPEIRRRGWIATADVPGVGRLEQPGLLIDLARNPGGVVSGPCMAGEHTAAILAELGYDAQGVADLVESRSVLQA